MNDLIPKLRWLLMAVALVLVVLIVLQLLGEEPASSDATALLTNAPATLLVPAATAAPFASAATPEPSRIAVDVIGAVMQPGLYWLDEPARVADAIDAAGGFTPDVDRDAINLAAVVADGQQIDVPHVGEQSAAVAQSESTPVAAAAGSSLININTADAATLDRLSGIGPATAQAIIEYRSTNGAFKRIEDIEAVSGIGPSIFAKIKAQITIDS